MSEELRQGITTGTCAAAAAYAAATLLSASAENDAYFPYVVDLILPDGSSVSVKTVFARLLQPPQYSGSYMQHHPIFSAEAGVLKDSGDDPDITDGCLVRVRVDAFDNGETNPAHLITQPKNAVEIGNRCFLLAGSGVGTVTKPGLSIACGEPAVNPVPRKMIYNAVRSATGLTVCLTVGIDNGEELARKTFNPRLGVVGGLSILGTTGRVRPFSHEAIEETVRCSIRVADGEKVKRLVLVPGHIGARAAEKDPNIRPIADNELAEVSNAWGIALEEATREGRGFEHIIVAGHPGKLAKLINNEWDTHSAHSGSAVPVVSQCAHDCGLKDNATQNEGETVEAIIQSLSPEKRSILGDELARRIALAIFNRYHRHVAVALFDMKENRIGYHPEAQNAGMDN